MKKLSKMLALALAALLLLATVPALAETPDGYPELRIDPLTGAPYDFGGIEIWVYDWWSPSDGARQEATNTFTEDTYEYQDWLMETYNFTLKQAAASDWNGNPEALLNYCNEENPSTLAIFIMRPDSVATPAKNGLLTPLDELDVDYTSDKYNQATYDTFKVGEHHYGFSVGKAEVRQAVFFNKRLLEEAGIDPDSLYTMVENDEWTWEAFEEMLATCAQDTDNDGVIDVYGMASNTTDIYLVATASNGGSFIDVVDGQFVITATEQNTIDAMNYAVDIVSKYQMPQPEGSEWNWFFPAFKSGMAAFHVGQCYEANPGSDLYGMEDDFGIVPFPKGTSDDAQYCHVQSENTIVIPGNIDRDTANKMAIAYDMWREDTPGYEDDEEGWKTDLYDRFYDDESIDITYALLRDNPVADTSIMLGSNNDVLGNGFFWNLPWAGTVAEVMESKLPTWQALVDDANGAN
ncbi:MAG: extracellular solute-binding protein [Clostridia bacterium]|nr:extracellular solute-binding protein [Clostridia bacterium]